MAEVKNICVEALERHCSSGETGRLDFRRGNYEAHVFTQDKFLVHAQLSGIEGIPALYRVLDWGDAETIWNPGIVAEHPTLHLEMEAATILYAEYLRERSVLEPREKEGFDEAFTSPDQAGGLESVLKYYTLSLECAEPELLPGGFTFADGAKSSYVIGSSEDCDVVLRHPSVDPLHCGVILEKGSVYIWDLGAQSGIKINGSPIAEATLKVGDVLTLGTLDVNVRFHLRRPNLNRPKTVPLPQMPARSGTQPLKEMAKGPITYDKVTRQLNSSGKGQSLFGKLGSLFGAKDRK